MTIENILKDYDIPIDEIEIGGCFIYENALHLRIRSEYVDSIINRDFPYTILNLETNCLNAVRNVCVKRVKAKIVLE